MGIGVEALRYDAAFEESLPLESFDLVYDAVGGDEQYRRSRGLLKAGGKYISAVGPVLHGGSEPITLRTILWTASVLVPRLLLNTFASRRYSLYLSFDVADLGTDDLREMIESGKLQVRLAHERFTLESLGQAHDKM